MYSRFIILLAVIGLCWAQEYYPRALQKDGVCPRVTGTCRVWCVSDMECPGDRKCCGTTCGGRLCQPPLTRRRVIPDEPVMSDEPSSEETSDSCPKPVGWVCSDACVSDKNCPKKKRCCKTRCGGKMCMKI